MSIEGLLRTYRAFNSRDLITLLHFFRRLGQAGDPAASRSAVIMARALKEKDPHGYYYSLRTRPTFDRRKKFDLIKSLNKNLSGG